MIRKVSIDFPLQKGLRLNLGYFSSHFIQVSIDFPLQKGLRRVPSGLNTLTCTDVSIDFPLQKGLRHD